MTTECGQWSNINVFWVFQTNLVPRCWRYQHCTQNSEINGITFNNTSSEGFGTGQLAMCKDHRWKTTWRGSGCQGVGWNGGGGIQKVTVGNYIHELSPGGCIALFWKSKASTSLRKALKLRLVGGQATRLPHHFPEEAEAQG